MSEINVRFARDGDFNGVLTLWDTCFPEDKKYGRLFFARRYRAENTVVIDDCGAIAGMLQMIPFDFSASGGGVIPASYIYGVGVHPDYRRQGLAADLMDQAFFEMHLRGRHIALLIPQNEELFRYYERFGFCHVFSLGSRAVKALPGAAVGEARRAGEEHIPGLAAVYEEAMSGAAHVMRDADCWSFLLMEHDFYVLTRGGEVTAYAAYERRSRGVVREAFGRRGEPPDGIISHALRINGRKSGVLLAPGGDKRLGCARVVNLLGTLETLPPLVRNGPVRVFDGLCRWNSGVYRMEKGKIVFEKPEESGGLPAVDGDRMTADILGGDSFMNLMHN